MRCGRSKRSIARRSSLQLLVASVLLVGCAKPAESIAPTIDRQLSDLLELLPGQYAGDAPKRMIPGAEMQRLVHRIRPVNAPQFGERVLYYQVTRDTVEGPILQAKVFLFATEADRQANTMRALVLEPSQAESLRSGDPADWRSLSPDRLMSFPETCHFTWTRLESGFLGEGSGKCSYDSKAFGQTIRPEMRYRITNDAFEFEETLLGEDGSAIVTTGGPLVAQRQ